VGSTHWLTAESVSSFASMPFGVNKRPNNSILSLKNSHFCTRDFNLFISSFSSTQHVSVNFSLAVLVAFKMWSKKSTTSLLANSNNKLLIKRWKNESAMLKLNGLTL
jgi:hypothetical protein